MSTKGLLGNGSNFKRRDDGARRVLAHSLAADNPFAAHDHFFRRIGAPLAVAANAPHLGVTVLVCLLYMDDRHVRPKRRNKHHRASIKG